METSIEKQLKAEIAHIFDSGANELRVFEMVKNFIDNRSLVKRYSNKINIARFPEDIYFKQDG
ncbi:hypothetical protein M3M33_17535, partial [Loigolactobacillus coryniformis]|uniref:hypothetical protein n=1 Tax=Loigolactobacillus coryniformis TaxID=1610 RepID=UPI00201A5717